MPREAHWPTGWTRKHGAIYYRVPRDVRHAWDGKAWFRLGRTEAEAWLTWYLRTEADASDDVILMSQAFERFERQHVPGLARETQASYRRALARLRPVFGAMSPSLIKPRHAYQYLERHAATPYQANRDVTVLSTVLSKCVRWGVLDQNVIRHGVERHPEPPRDRYVTDDELVAFLDACGPDDIVTHYVRLKLLTGLRGGQLHALRVRDYDAQAGTLTAPAAKRGRVVEYRGDALVVAVERLLAIGPRRIGEARIIVSPTTGKPYASAKSFQGVWRIRMRRYQAAGGRHFREHDLRAKTASDTTLERAQALLGHTSPAVTRRVYQRRPVQIEVD